MSVWSNRLSISSMIYLQKMTPYIVDFILDTLAVVSFDMIVVIYDADMFSKYQSQNFTLKLLQ